MLGRAFLPESDESIASAAPSAALGSVVHGHAAVGEARGTLCAPVDLDHFQVNGDHLVIREAAGSVAVMEAVPVDVEAGVRTLGDWLMAVLEFRGAELPTDLGALRAVASQLERQLSQGAGENMNLLEAYARYSLERETVAPRRGAIDGASFILTVPPDPPAIWGSGNRVLWVQGEGFLLVGPQGVGKTTIAQQLVLGLIGLRDEVLGIPVVADDRPVLYLAMDRPQQIARSWRRMVLPEDRQSLSDRLRVWQGPLPFNVVKEPRALAAWARDEHGAGTIVVDSYKDLAPELSREETGAQVNAALQEVVAEGMQWLGLHHQRKSTAENKRPKSLSDVYGSNWLTAGTGSVLLVWGDPGDSVVEGIHLKQPAEPVNLTISHDHGAGHSVALDVSLGAGQDRQTVRRRQLIALFQGRPGELLDLTQVMEHVQGADRTIRADLKDLTGEGVLVKRGAPGQKDLWTGAPV